MCEAKANLQRRVIAGGAKHKYPSRMDIKVCQPCAKRGRSYTIMAVQQIVVLTHSTDPVKTVLRYAVFV
eukprot:2720613-Amphidinium_carterae.1